MNILMVCMGNICRSPMAEGIAKNLSASKPTITIDSAGTHAYHVGHAPDKRAIDVVKAHGINIANLKARQITAEDLDKFDVIMVADQQNYTNVYQLAQTEQHRQKIVKMLAKHPDQPNEDLPDPYYQDNEAFKSTYQLLHTALTHWFDAL